MKRSPPWSRGRRCWRGRTFRVSSRRGGRGQHLRGIEAIQRSLALDSQNAEAHRNLAVALEQDGQALSAAAHYRAFLALAPGHPDRAQIEQLLRSPGPAEARR